MGDLAVSLTVLTSIFALLLWLKLLGRRVNRLRGPVEIGNLRMDVPGVIGMYRPDPFRAFCNSAALALSVLLFGLPHFLAIWQFWRRPETDLWHYIHYLWSLIYWLALLGFPAFLFARSREARARRLTGQSPEG